MKNALENLSPDEIIKGYFVWNVKLRLENKPIETLLSYLLNSGLAKNQYHAHIIHGKANKTTIKWESGLPFPDNRDKFKLKVWLAANEK